MIDELVQALTDRLSLAEKPVLCWSGGNDSTFLLKVMLDAGLKFSVLTFHHMWTKKQRKRILDIAEENNLTVFFYSPIRVDYQEPFVTVDYRMGGTVIKQILDHVPSDRCGIDVGKEAMRESHLQPPYIWDLTIVGTKETDRHELVDSFSFTDIGDHEFYRPLWWWTDQQVIDAAAERGYELTQTDTPEGDTGNYIACMACMCTNNPVFCPKTKQMIQGSIKR